MIVALATVASGVGQEAPRVAVPAGPPRDRPLIWVLQADGRLLLYDGVDFRNWLSLTLTAECRDPLARLEFYREMMLCSYPVGGSMAQRTIWITMPPASPRWLLGGADERRPASGGGVLQTTASPQLAFSADGRRLYWFENRMTELTRGEQVTRQPSAFIAWTTDLEGGGLHEVANLPLPACPCTTGACEETCPEIQVWTPEEGVDDFFLAGRYVPGQLGAEYIDDLLYRRQGDKWTAPRLPVIETVLDAKQHGDLILGAVGDGGCCGWENEGDDRTFVSDKGQVTFIFDERERFANPDYDVSFFTPRARFSPDATQIAYTVASTARPGEEIRLADSGKQNVAELARVKKAIAEVPRVEVLAVAAPKQVVASAAGELVGWLDERRVLIAHEGVVTVMDAVSGAVTATPIKASNAAKVWLR